jgi:hypothetical protein
MAAVAAKAAMVARWWADVRMLLVSGAALRGVRKNRHRGGRRQADDAPNNYYSRGDQRAVATLSASPANHMPVYRLRFIVALCAFAFAAPTRAQTTPSPQPDSVRIKALIQQKLMKALRDSHVTVVAGLKAAESKGKPLSAKFIYTDGLYLSVFLEKGGAYYEALVGGKSGVLRRTTKLTDSTEMQRAAQQDSVLAKATGSLEDAIGKLALVPTNKGWDPVSITPMLKSDAPVAEIMVRKGPMGRKVIQPMN